MTIIEIAKLDNGAHGNQTIFGVDPFTFPVPEGWAIFPDDMERENFPFGDVTVEDKEYVSDKFFVPKPVPEDLTEESAEGAEEPKEPEMEPLKVIVPTVTSWTPGVIPDPDPTPAPQPTQLDRVEAQSTYTAMMTNTLLTTN